MRRRRRRYSKSGPTEPVATLWWTKPRPVNAPQFPAARTTALPCWPMHPAGRALRSRPMNVLSMTKPMAEVSSFEKDMRILVVEDDAKIASFVVNGLKQNGFAVDRCADGEDALVHATSTTYDAAIVDIMLPKL